MTEEKLNVAAFQDFVKRGLRDLRMFEIAGNIADTISQAENIIRQLNTKKEILAKEIEDKSREHEIVDSKLKIAKQEVAKRNTLIGEKNQKIEELDKYLSGGFRNKEAELEAEHVAKTKDRNMELKAIEAKIEGKHSEYLQEVNKLDSVKAELRKFKETLVV